MYTIIQISIIPFILPEYSPNLYSFAQNMATGGASWKKNTRKRVEIGRYAGELTKNSNERDTEQFVLFKGELQGTKKDHRFPPSQISN